MGHDFDDGSDTCSREGLRISEPHSKCLFFQKRVGHDPLETAVLSRTSGVKPTRIEYFSLNEWVHILENLHIME